MSLELQDFFVEPATWSVDRDALSRVRTEVFIVEQAVPEDEEFDGLDPSCQHVLAWSLDGTPIGTARLTPDGRIGRMAVLEAHRGKGIGAALLRTALEQARSRGLPEVRLAAQTHALDFYRREGFEAYGEVFDDVGIPHRWMKRALDPADLGPVERRRREAEAIDGSEPRHLDRIEDYRAALLELIGACRHELVIYTRDLEPPVLGEEAVVEALRKLASEAVQPRIRIMLMDSSRAIKDRHLLVPLAHRLTSVIGFRQPGAQHRESNAAFAIADGNHAIHREFGDRWEGVFRPNDRAFAAPLLGWFDEAWELGHRDPDLERLDL